MFPVNGVMIILLLVGGGEYGSGKSVTHERHGRIGGGVGGHGVENGVRLSKSSVCVCF